MGITEQIGKGESLLMRQKHTQEAIYSKLFLNNKISKIRLYPVAVLNKSRQWYEYSIFFRHLSQRRTKTKICLVLYKWVIEWKKEVIQSTVSVYKQTAYSKYI